MRRLKRMRTSVSLAHSTVLEAEVTHLCAGAPDESITAPAMPWRILGVGSSTGEDGLGVNGQGGGGVDSRVGINRGEGVETTM